MPRDEDVDDDDNGADDIGGDGESAHGARLNRAYEVLVTAATLPLSVLSFKCSFEAKTICPSPCITE